MRIGDMIEIYCGNFHETPVRMEIREGCEGKDNFFVCPKYKPENREEYEPACANNLSFRDYCEILQTVEKLLNDNANSDSEINYTNYKFKVGPRGGFKTECVILKHTPTKVKIAILNRKCLQERK